MADTVDKATRSRMMSAIKSKDTKPEIFLRKALHAEGFRYRLGGCGLPGKPDLVFPSRRTVVFVHGCFWHRHGCSQFRWPGSNQEFWADKLNSNAARDCANEKALHSMGWLVLVVWECELKATKYTLPNDAVLRIATALNVQSKGKK
jgi:DNA mismatch endonuclease (patch repair protein)